LPAHERAAGGHGRDQALPRGQADGRLHLDRDYAWDLLEHFPCGYAVVATDGTLLYANKTFLQLIGRDEASVAHVRFQELLTPGGAIFYEMQFAPSLLLRGSLEEISFEFLKDDGERVPTLVNAILRPEQGQMPAHILLAAFGAKQRRLYESELLRARRESEQVSEVVRRSSDAIIRLSADDLIETWNRGAQQIFGFPADKAVGKSIYLLISEESRAPLAKTIEKVKRGAEVVTETVGRRQGDAPVDMSISMTPHLEAPGIFVGYSAIIRDVTARKLSEKALLQTEKLASVGRLASSIAHEINNPLEAVTNLLYILGKRDTDGETKALIHTAQEELARVSQIATHTLRFHKQSSGRTAVDLRGLFDSVLGLYRARLQNSGITAVNDCRASSQLVCYEGELRQVLVNLVANSFDAMRSGGTLTLRCREAAFPSSASRGIRITVADTGTGMDKAVTQRLFEPFFSTKGIGGTGLGLWITRDLVAKNNGSIRVRSSTRPGRAGTVISMLFPSPPE
jgi:PAS domain S-box-containing protein